MVVGISRGMDRPILYTCPETRMKVQHWLPPVRDDEPNDVYSQVVCPACTRRHLLNTRTGKLLTED